MSNRTFDLVLFGATGFTGQLVAEYIAQHAPATLTWAVAGRRPDALDDVIANLARVAPRGPVPSRVLADATDAESLQSMAQSTVAVCTTVGPYLRYGIQLAAACASAGTHYCDLTGEVPFVRRSIDAHHERAIQTGARIVHCCGYDSIPSDLGTLMVQRAMVEAGGPASRVTTVVGPTRGGMSGGTAHSMLAVMDAVEDPDVRRASARTYALDPEDGPRGPRQRDQISPTHMASIQQWTAPFFMAPINTRVVRRSHALLGHPWGTEFRYAETMATGDGLRGRLTASAITAGLGALLGAASSRLGRRILTKTLLPAPGDGPSKSDREAGFFRHLVLAESEDPSHRMTGRVIGTKDPGYGETAKMLGETALCLAHDHERLPDIAGVLTPATAAGFVLIDRLRDAGMTWSVEPWPTDGRAPRP